MGSNTQTKKEKDKRKRKWLAFLILLLFIPILAWGAIGTLTDIDVNGDVYTVGNIEIQIVSSSGSLENLVPNATVPYGIAAKNVGINDAYIFMSITVPCENVEWTDDNGKLHSEALTQIFSYYSNTDKLQNEWKLVSVGVIEDNQIRDVSYIQNNTAQYGSIFGDAITYVYGYVGDNADGSLKALAPDYETSNLIDYLKLANVSNPASMIGEITTKLYGIQVTKLDGGIDEVDAVWDIVNDAVRK